MRGAGATRTGSAAGPTWRELDEVRTSMRVRGLQLTSLAGSEQVS